MLFDRFIFVLYLLLHYTWFLLGTLYETPFRYIPLVSMACSLLCLIVISLFQLQAIIHKKKLSTSEKWSGIAWSVVHLILFLILTVDALEWANPVVVFGLAGFLMSIVILMVGGCACFVIMEDGDDWHAHIHLTCIGFWVIVQYMAVRLPELQLQYVTVVPILLMAMTRLVEVCLSKSEIFAWGICIILHVFRDTNNIDIHIFYWLMSLVVLLLAAPQWKNILTMTALPFLSSALGLYIAIALMQGEKLEIVFANVGQLYAALTDENVLIVLPLDGDDDDEDWDERL